MPPRPTINASNRSAAPKDSSSGPSCTRRTSTTRPNDSPSADTTRLDSTSLRRTVLIPRKVAKDVVACPAFRGERGHVLPLDGESDAVAQVAHPAEGDADGRRLMRRSDLRHHPLHPRAETLATQARSEHTGAGQDGADEDPSRLRVPLQLDVVHLPAGLAVPVDELAVQQVQGGVQAAPGSHH